MDSSKEKPVMIAIHALTKKYGLSTRYVTDSALGKRTGPVPDKIKKDYREMVEKINSAINVEINK